MKRVLDGLSSTRFYIDMAIFLGVMLGNVLAWCVHLVTWWLRQHGLKWIGVFGGLCSVPLAFLTLVGVLSDFFHFYVWCCAALLWIGIVSIGCLQSRWIAGEKDPGIFAVWAFVAEILLSFVVAFIGLCCAFTSSVAFDSPINAYLLTFSLTLLLLAIFRPLVVRYSQRFWHLIRPEHIEPAP